MKQSKGLNGDPKPEHTLKKTKKKKQQKKQTKRITMSSAIDIRIVRRQQIEKGAVI